MPSHSPPHPQDVLRAAFDRAATTILRDNLTAYIVLAILCVIDGAIMSRYTIAQLYETSFPLTSVLVLLGSFFTLAAAVRTRFPEFRMRVLDVVALIALTIGWLAATAAGTVALIVPGVWVSTKLSLVQFTYLLNRALSNGGIAAVQQSWALTTGYFWPTMWFFVLAVFAVMVPTYLLTSILVAWYEVSPASAYASAPALFIVQIVICQWINIACLDWTLQLRTLRGLGGTADVDVPEPGAPQPNCD